MCSSDLEVRDLKQEEEIQGLLQEASPEVEGSQEVEVEMGKRMRHELKHKLRPSHSHKTEIRDEMMMMMTYSMVPVRELTGSFCQSMSLSSFKVETFQSVVFSEWFVVGFVFRSKC